MMNLIIGKIKLKEVNDAKLKKQAIEEWKDCYECGHFPDFICDQPYVSEEELQDYAKEYDMTLEEFKKVY